MLTALSSIYREYKVYCYKRLFLPNISNKDKFLRENLRQQGCDEIFADEDADVEIAKASVQRSLVKYVTLISFSTPFVPQFEMLAI